MRIMVPIDVFGVAVYFFFGDEELKRFYKETGIKEIEPTARGFTANNATWVKDDNDMNTIIHEAYHLTHFLLDCIHTKDEETGAYLIEYIVQYVVNAIRKRKKQGLS